MQEMSLDYTTLYTKCFKITVKVSLLTGFLIVWLDLMFLII